MTSYTYEVTVSEQHWLEGCDYAGLGVENACECCPIYRAMAESGLPVREVYPGYWAASWGSVRTLPEEVTAAIGQFDNYRLGERAHLPEPITFTVELSE